MPFVKITSSVELPAGKTDSFLAALSKEMAEATGKPERYMMVVFETGSVMLGGKPGPGAFACFKSWIGLSYCA
jgi:phenylpyruvate tautomerase PptA (4-oxalocrotonate tautomerase family)